MSAGAWLRNTGWNLFGMTLPVFAALIAIPPLIKAMGVERFGVLSVGWVVMGYFALFDLGLGRATTKFAAELLEKADRTRLGDVLWTSVHLHVVLGLAGGGLFAALTPWLIFQGFNIPPALVDEARSAFYWLAASIPFVVVAAALRGALEAAGRFDAINGIRVAGSLLNYLAPLLVVQFTQNLGLMVAAMAIGRVLVLLALIAPARKAIAFGAVRGITAGTVRPLFAFGGWVLLSNLVAPLIIVTDRLFVAAFLSMGAVTYYVTPYEVVTKLWILSASLMGAMFPLMVSLAATDRAGLRQIGLRAERYLLAATAPLAAAVIVFGREFFLVWLGIYFAEYSTAVAKWLAAGILVNIVAQVPITALQAAGRPDLIAKVQLAQLVPFAAITWVLLHTFGSVGVAMAWAARALVEGLVTCFIAGRVLGGRFGAVSLPVEWLIVWLFLGACWLIDSTWRLQTMSKLALFVPLMAVFLFWQWRILLNAGERAALRARLRRSHAEN